MKKKNGIGECLSGIIVLLVIYELLNDPGNFKGNRLLIKELSWVAVGIVIISFVIVFLKKYKKKKFYLASGINEIDKFSGIEFENLLAVYFKEMGYKVKTTPASNDYGADLVLHKDNKCVIVQAKRYKNKVGISAIQQIAAAKAYYKADRTIVVTNSYYTKQAVNLAKKCDVQLIDRDELIKIMATVNGNEKVRKVKNVEEIICNKCGAMMVKKKGKYGEFWGCSNYPKCKNTIKINKKG